MSRPQLFCFPYAGGNRTFFNDIEKDLNGIDVVKLEYAGHGERRKEDFYKSFDSLADDMFQVVRDRVVGSYALFGYSMGSITVVEVLRRIVAAQGECGNDFQLPYHIFLAAHEPHKKSELSGYTSDELDEWVMKKILEFGDVPEKLVNNSVFWKMYLPLYRADYTMMGKYDLQNLSDFRTEIPATVFYSETDTPLRSMREWEKYFKGVVEYEGYTGKHFFIKEHHKSMAEVAKRKLIPCIEDWGHNHDF